MASLGSVFKASASPTSLNAHKRSPAEEADRARDALWAIDAGCDRESWVRIGMAAKVAGLSFDDFDRWSASGANYTGQRDTRAVWASFHDGGGIGPGTLFAAARDAGWRDDHETQAAPTGRAVTAPIEARTGSGSTLDFRSVWDESEAADASHPYIARKLGSPIALRVYRGPLLVAGQPLDGALLVPAFDAAGDLQSWQAIPAELQARKLNAPRAAMAGARFEVGGPVYDGDTLYLVEGIGAAWSVHQATGKTALCCFGSGNVERVARDLRERHPASEIVIVCDRGKEPDAERIAGDIGGAWVGLPQSWPANSDVNDLHQREGLEALANILVMTKRAEPSIHPLARFIPLETEPKPPRWVLPGFLAEEMLVIAGPPGIGKTSVILPLLLTAAGLYREGDPLGPMPDRWRHCVFVTEDVGQAMRILVGAVEHGERGIHWGSVHERVHLVRAQRMSPAEVAEVAPAWRDFVRVVDGVELPPVVVLDTRSAVLAVGDENDNAAASEAVATLREAFPDWPQWVIAHTAKTDSTRTDVTALSPRGAGAWVGDGAGTAFILPGDCENERRFVLGKTRNSPAWRELRAVLRRVDAEALNAWGEPEPIRLEWAEAAPLIPENAKTRAEAEHDRKIGEAAELRLAVLEAVETAWSQKWPLSRSTVPEKVGRNRRAALQMVESLIADGLLHSISVPAKIRVNANKKEFLVRLTQEEREEFSRSGRLPERFNEIPLSWRKPEEAADSVPGGVDVPEKEAAPEGKAPAKTPRKRRRKNAPATTKE